MFKRYYFVSLSNSCHTVKYLNLPMYHFQKWLGFPIFCDFDTCHKEITIDSRIGSPCIISSSVNQFIIRSSVHNHFYSSCVPQFIISSSVDQFISSSVHQVISSSVHQFIIISSSFHHHFIIISSSVHHHLIIISSSFQHHFIIISLSFHRSSIH